MGSQSDREDSGTGAKEHASRASRKLSGARLARKRELDRQAQHDARRKTKDYIAHLESLVASYKQTGSADPSLMQQIEEKRKLNERLANALRSIGRVVDANVKSLEWEPPSVGVKRDSSDQSDGGQSPDQPDRQIELLLGSEKISQAAHSRLAGVYNMQSPFEVIDIPHLGCKRPVQTLPKQILNNSKPCRCSRPWRFVNEVLNQQTSIREDQLLTPNANDMEIPIQGIMLGWDVVERMYDLSPVWKVLRQVDEGVFFPCGPVERLATMANMHLQMRYMISPTKENLNALAWFLRPRPCQQFVQHTLALNYFPWPGLRERYVFGEHEYCGEKFAKLFVDCLRVHWPFDYHATYIKNPDTGAYEYSPLFKEKIADLSCWTMDAPFFDVVPQLQGDIAPFTPTPSPLNLNHFAPYQTVSNATPTTSTQFYSEYGHTSVGRGENYGGSPDSFSTNAIANATFLPAGLSWEAVLQLDGQRT